MKAGFIITTKKEDFQVDIEKAKKLDWVLNAGLESEIRDEKYIFTKYTDDTDFYKIASYCREHKMEKYVGGNVEVDIIRKENIGDGSYDELPIPENQKTLDDVALVMCGFFYNTDARVDSIIKGIEQLRRLNPMPKIIFYEAGVKPIFKDLMNNDIYKFIEVSDKNKNLWQKEALFNLAVKENKFDYYIFHDADCFPDSPDWAEYIKKVLSENENTIIQGCYRAEDTVYKGRDLTGHIFTRLNRNPPNERGNPGLSMSMSYETWKAIKGWTPYLIGGSGDGILINAVAKNLKYKTDLANDCPWWALEVTRHSTPIIKYLFAPYQFTHISHGDFKNRGYYWRNKVVQWLGVDDIRNYVRLGENGIIEWIGDQKKLQYVLENKSRLQDQEGALSVLKDSIIQ